MGSIGQTVYAWLGAAGGLGTVVSYLAYRLSKRQMRQDATATVAATASSLTQAAVALLEPAQRAAAEGERRAATLRTQITDLEGVVASLSHSLSLLTEQAAKQQEASDRRLERFRADCEAETSRLRELLASARRELAIARGEMHAIGDANAIGDINGMA